MNCHRKRNLYREVNDGINQQQKSCVIVGKGSEHWSGQEGFQKDLSKGLQSRGRVTADGG